MGHTFLEISSRGKEVLQLEVVHFHLVFDCNNFMNILMTLICEESAWCNEITATITMRALGGGSHLLRVLSQTLCDSYYCLLLRCPRFRNGHTRYQLIQANIYALLLCVCVAARPRLNIICKYCTTLSLNLYIFYYLCLMMN